jgi:hypothetical protein
MRLPSEQSRPITYLVEQDHDGRWNVTRGGAPTGAFARDKTTAIGQAYAAATREAATTNLKVIVYSVQADNCTTEWESP